MTGAAGLRDTAGQSKERLSCKTLPGMAETYYEK